jgi:predicted nucleic acid-binding protein
VLDAEAMSALAGGPVARKAEVQAAMRVAFDVGRDVVVPTLILAELYRGPRLNHMLDACLSRETGLQTRDTDRTLARMVGGVLAGSDAGSELLADAHVVAVAVEAGGGVVLTGDARHLERLAAPYPHVLVQPLP